MGVYVYRIKEDYVHKSSIKGREYENDWFSLKKDGTITVKGSNKSGYAWDGCSPKWKIKDMYFGTLEGVLSPETGVSKTYYASMIHDVFYQFHREVKSFIKRKEADTEFYNMLRRDGFKPARLYYRSVRLVGWVFWIL